MSFKVDGTLYPDVDPPETLITLESRIDFIARLCSAWDFGLLPDPGTLEEIRRAPWRQPIDECRLLTSPMYHLLRRWHELPPLPFLGSLPACITNDPNLEFV